MFSSRVLAPARRRDMPIEERSFATLRMAAQDNRRRDSLAMLGKVRARSLTLLSDEGIHGSNRRLRRENFLGKDAVNLRIGVEAGVLQDDAAVIQVGGAPQRGKRDAAGGNPEEHQIFNSARAQDQVQLVLRERAHALLINDEVFGASNRAVDLSGRRGGDEKIVVLQSLPARLRVRKFGMARGKSQSHVDDQKLFLACKIHGFSRVGNDGFGCGDKPNYSVLDIESQQSCLFRIEFHVSSFPIISTTQDITSRPLRRPRRRRQGRCQQLQFSRCRFGYESLFTSVRLGGILPALRVGGTSMRNKTQEVALFAAVLAVILSSVLAIPAFASGDDKPATPASTATSSASARPAPNATPSP